MSHGTALPIRRREVGKRMNWTGINEKKSFSQMASKTLLCPSNSNKNNLKSHCVLYKPFSGLPPSGLQIDLVKYHIYNSVFLKLSVTLNDSKAS